MHQRQCDFCSDPAIRWQVQRDLLTSSTTKYEASIRPCVRKSIIEAMRPMINDQCSMFDDLALRNTKYAAAKLFRTQDVRIVRLEPVPEAATHQRGVRRPRRSPQQIDERRPLGAGRDGDCDPALRPATRVEVLRRGDRARLATDGAIVELRPEEPKRS